MAVPDRNNLPFRTNQTEQYVLNYSFDEVYKILMVGLAAYNPNTNTYDRVQVNAAGELVTTTSAGGGSSSSKAINAYAYSAKAVTATYKYFYFEDASLNWYVMRKNISTGVVDYTKGTGGYATVYVDAVSAPSGSPTYASYGTTF